MGRYIRWQAILALTGIAMIMAFLAFLALSRTTTVISKIGGVYTEGVVGRPRFINPLLAQYNQVDQDLTALIFNGLTKMDGNGKLTPDLAQSWTVSEDGLTYEFNLKQTIRWQDGERFTADDVLFTMSLMQDSDFPGAPYLHQLWQTVSVEKINTYTLRFTLTEPFPAFAEFTTIGILPEHVLGQTPAEDLLNHPFNLQPVGTGPFKLEAINADIARLAPNPFYTGQKSRLTGFELQFFSTPQEIIKAYQGGQIEGISWVPPHTLPWAEHFEGLDLYTARLSGYDIVYLNLQNANTAPFFQEKAVRQALLSGLNRQTIVDHALNGQGIVANGPILPWNWAYNPDQPATVFNPNQANLLLTESGWIDSDGDGIRDKDGQPLAFTLLTSENPTKIKVSETIRDQWQPLGVSVTIEVVEEGFTDRLIQQDFQAALTEVLLAGDPDPYPFWHQTQIGGGQNYAGWDHIDASKLLEEARTITDRGQRIDYYYEFQHIFAEEVPSLILYYPVYNYGLNHNVLDVQLAPLTKPSDRFNTATNWYMLTEQVIYSDAGLQ